MKCPSCTYKEMKEDTTTYYVKVDSSYFIIENVPCLICDRCGEEYFRASVIEHIEKIVKALEDRNEKVTIADYQSAA
ncbi:MAG: type II toxin-antitoxin system MqsA family antitoxin [Selenomonadaceae bacterium]